jgi:hypothetical protein
MKLSKFIDVFDKKTCITIYCDKELEIEHKTLFKGKVSELDNSVLNDGQVKFVKIINSHVVIDVSLDYMTLVKHLFEQNAKLINSMSKVPTLREDENGKAENN